MLYTTLVLYAAQAAVRSDVTVSLKFVKTVTQLSYNYEAELHIPLTA
jgi:hypothetical protein